MTNKHKSSPSKLKVVSALMLTLLVLFGVSVKVFISSSPSSELASKWQQKEIVSNDAFFLLAGFNAPSEFDPLQYGKQQWQAFLVGEEPQLSDLPLPEDWYVEMPCNPERIECDKKLSEFGAYFDNELETNKAWLLRLRKLLTGEAPLGAEEREDGPYYHPYDNLNAALELKRIGIIRNIETSDKQAAFNELNQHLNRLVEHVRKTNVFRYRQALERSIRQLLGWLVARGQNQPQVVAQFITQLDILQQQPDLNASVLPVLQREYAAAQNAFSKIDKQGLTSALDWDLEVSDIFQTLTWRHQRSLDVLAENYQYASELSEGSHGIDPLIHLSEEWRPVNDIWQDNNLVGAALVQDRLAILSGLLKSTLHTEAYYKLAAAWFSNLKSGAELPIQTNVLGQVVDIVKRPLEQRVCLELPVAESLDEFCLRLFKPGNLPELKLSYETEISQELTSSEAN